MNSFRICLVTALMGALSMAQAQAQQDTVTTHVSGTPAVSATVPRLIRMRGSLVDSSGKPMAGPSNIEFTLYKDQAGGPALWQETQSIQLDATGHYEALLGATSQEGLPLSVFTSGEARWLGVQVEGQPEQPRVLLLSVAYALKAADAETLGGKPASAYVLAGSQNAFLAATLPNSSVKPSGAMPFTPMNGGGGKPAITCPQVSADGSGTANQIVKFSDACDIQNSAIFESGGNVGIGNTSPAGVLDVSGNTFIRGGLTLPATGTATSVTPWPSNAFDLLASSFSSTSSSAVAQDFRWMAEPAGNNTANPSGTLNLLFGSGGNTPNETGLSIGPNGVILFAPGQTFPGAGSGTVTSVGTSSGLTGGPITGSGTIGIATGGVTNLMLANPFVTVQAGSGLSGGGQVALGGTITLTNTAPSSGGTVTNVASGTGLSGGPITGSGTLSLNTAYTDARYLQLVGGTLIGGLNGTTGNFAGIVQTGGIIAAPLGTATPSQAFTASPLDSQASVYNTSVSKAAIYFYRWEAEPFGNNSSGTGANLNLLFGTPGIPALETGLSINRSGIITFAPGQTFPGGSGTVTSVATGAGLTGGPITTSGTISILPAGVTNSMLANPSITVQAGTGLSGGGTVALGGTVTLNSTSSGGTVTSVATGAGLTGGPVTSSGTISIPPAGVSNSMLANPSITVQAGTGLSGGGTVALGGTVTLNSTSSGGTITGVTAGSGLQGGGSSGNVTLSLLQTCSAGQVLAWSGASWVCSTPSSGGISGTTDGIAYFSAPGSLTSTAAPTNGQILIGSTGGAPVLKTLTAGSNVTITNAPGSITIASTGGGGGPPTLPYFLTADGRTTQTDKPTLNVNKLWGFLLPYNVTTTQVVYDVMTIDNTANLYDIGIYNTSGTLLVDLGPTPGTTFAKTAGFKVLTWTQGSTPLTAGKYYIGFTSNCTASCAAIAAGTDVSFAGNTSAGSSTGGALSHTVTAPADVWNAANVPTIVIE